MLSLHLPVIISKTYHVTYLHYCRTFYLSMFEIYSERGKGEKIMDLSQEGGDLFMQQSNIKGLKEVLLLSIFHI